MDIAAMFTSISSVSSAAEKRENNKPKDHGAFGEFMNTVISAAKKARKAAPTTEKTESSPIQTSKNGFNKLDDDKMAEVAASMQLPEKPLTPQEQEAMERIAILVSDGSLDPQMLEGMDEQEVAELVEWVMSGASGLFEAYSEAKLTDELSLLDPESPLSFGLGNQAVALAQLEQLYQRINNEASTSEEATAMTGKLLELENLSLTEIDNVAQAILEALAAEEVTGDEDLRELISKIPAEELKNVLEEALAKTSAKPELPQIPESVLRSLCIEVINVNNAELDAAEKQRALLDGLNNNQALREQLLEQVTTADGAKLRNTVDENVLKDNVTPELLENQEEMTEEVIEEETEKLPDQKTTTTTETTSGTNNEAIQNTADEEVSSEAKTPKVTQIEAGKAVTSEEEVILTEDEENTEDTKETKATVKEAPSRNETLKTKDELTGRELSTTKNEEKEENTENKDNSENKFSDKAASQFEFEATGIKTSTEGAEAVKFEIPEIESLDKSQQTNATINAKQERYNQIIENIEKIEKLIRISQHRSMRNVTIQLSPPELGKMSIDVEVKNSTASASIRVESDAARNMLLTSLEQLKRNLENHGIKLESFDVSVDQENGQNQGRNAESWQAVEDQRDKYAKNAARGAGNNQGIAEEENEIINDSQDGPGVLKDGSVNIVA